MTPQSSDLRCRELAALVDGQLGVEAADRLRQHLGGCPHCQTAAHDALQLSRLAADPHAFPRVAPGRRERGGGRASSFRRLAVLAALSLTAAAAAALVMWPKRARAPGPEQLWAKLTADSPRRALEGRLALPAADRHRPYDVDRGAAASARVSYATLAQLDDHGAATALLLAGDTALAAQHLERLAGAAGASGPSPALASSAAAVASDRALVALLRGAAGEALVLADEALASAPGLLPARWNRALALRDLGLSLAAAHAFEELAARGEPGWSTEAAERERALRESTLARGASWRAARAAGVTMRAGGAVVPPEVVHAHPGITRLFFYDAVRAAPSRQRVLALAPVAAALDEASGGQVLSRYLTQVAAADFAVRAPLAAAYAALVDGRLDDAASRRLIERLRRAHQDDQLLGALFLADAIPTHLDEYRRLAEASADPWFRAIFDHQAARRSMARGELLLAEQRLVHGLEACRTARIDYRCEGLAIELVWLYGSFHRPVEARSTAEQGWQRTRASGEWGFESMMIQGLGYAAGISDAFALGRAALEEVSLRQLGDCRVDRYVQLERAILALKELRPEEARAALAATPLCGEPPPVALVDEYGDLAHFSLTAAERRNALTLLEQLRRRGALTPAQQAIADSAQGRLLLEPMPERARQLLEQAIARADRLPRWDADAQRTRWDAYTALISQASRAGRPEEAIGLLAREAGLRSAARCTVALSLNHDELVVGVRGAAGELVHHYEPHHAGAVDPARVIEAPMLQVLAGCPIIDVLARPPFQGRSDLLPPGLAWRYRLGAGANEPAPASTTRLVISDVEAPAHLMLPTLRPWSASALPGEQLLTLQGPAATPSRVLAEMQDAAEVEFHTHGIVDSAISDVSLLVLSPDADQQYALTAGQLRNTHLRGAPLVVLAACRAAGFAPYQHQAWSLPAAFLHAGARSVMASPSPLSDAEAGPFFASVRARIHRGLPPAVALRDERVEWLSRSPTSSVRDVLLFE